MAQGMMEVTRDRFHLLDPDIYILQGFFPEGEPAGGFP